MRAAGLHVDPLKGWKLFGSTDRVAVVLTFAPTARRKTHIVVVADSTIAATAESTRNQIVSLILKAPASVPFDRRKTADVTKWHIILSTASRRLELARDGLCHLSLGCRARTAETGRRTKRPLRGEAAA
jgi:F420-0:gamma-glutamyl ligase